MLTIAGGILIAIGVLVLGFAFIALLPVILRGGFIVFAIVAFVVLLLGGLAG